MRNSIIQLTLAIIVLVIGASLEELLPKFLGVGFPVLLSAVQLSAHRRAMLAAVIFAIAAGAAEDSISSLPIATSVSYFLLAAILVRWIGLPRAMMLASYPIYQAWLLPWMGGKVGEGVFLRMMMAIPIGAATILAVDVILRWAERKAAIDEQG